MVMLLELCILFSYFGIILPKIYTLLPHFIILLNTNTFFLIYTMSFSFYLLYELGLCVCMIQNKVQGVSEEEEVVIAWEQEVEIFLSDQLTPDK